MKAINVNSGRSQVVDQVSDIFVHHLAFGVIEFFVKDVKVFHSHIHVLSLDQDFIVFPESRAGHEPSQAGCGSLLDPQTGLTDQKVPKIVT